MDKEQALANYLDIDVDEVESYGSYFEADGQEFIVAKNYDDAYDLAVESVIDLQDDIGIVTEGMTDILKYEVEDIINDQFKNSTDEVEAYMDSLEDEEREDAGEYDNDYEFMEDVYGETPFEHLMEMGLYDVLNNMITVAEEKKIAEFCVDIDGVAHFLASYDGLDIELEKDMYAFRTN